MGSLFDETVNKIKEKRNNLLSGKANCIPFESFPRFKNYLPGIIQGTNWIITASSGVGKSSLTQFLFINEPYSWIKKNPNSGITFKVFYFALEESKEEFMYKIISNQLYAKYGIEIDVLQLQSYFQDKKKQLTNDIIEKIESLKEYFSDLEEHVTIIDSISNPTGIYRYMKNYSNLNGTHYYYNFKEDRQKKNTISKEKFDKLEDKKNWAYSHYTPNNPNEYVIVIADHVSLLQPEAGASDLHKAMSRLSAEYGRKNLAKHFNYVVVLVQQQSAEKEKKQWTNSGDQIDDKMEPSLDGLADNKTTQRDALVVLGLYAPDRYKIPYYKVGNVNYNVAKLGDNFRVLSVLKNRIGKPNARLPLIFNGAVNNFYEAPKFITDEDYNYFIEHKKFPQKNQFNF
jgi:hypothetical protein